MRLPDQPQTPVKPAFIPLIKQFQQWLEDHKGLHFKDYAAFWQWSIDEQNAFWMCIWEYDRFESPISPTVALADTSMPGASWFPGTQVNYAQRVLRHAEAAAKAGVPAIIADNELGEARELSWPELKRQVASLALTLRELGVEQGDRVAAYLPNTPEAVVAFLACVSVGAIWSICAPDMGTQAVTDRFQQIKPKILIATDGVYYAGKPQDRGAVVAELRQKLPSVEHLIVVRGQHAKTAVADAMSFADATARAEDETAGFRAAWLPFDHPLWIVYSSGTTGLPKALVHGHGGVMLMAAASRKHNDTGCSYDTNSFGERFHWYSSTGWIMWNAQIAALLDGTTICLFDGSPGGSKETPDWSVLWRFAARHKVTWFGAGAAFYANCMKADVAFDACGDLSRVRALGSTGSPLAEDVQRWVSEQFEQLGTHDIWWNNISGGTDFAGAFFAGNRELPPTPGRLQCRQLGSAVEAWNEQGHAVQEEVGELVCRLPLPSMPIYLWNDESHARYLASYFDTWPKVWRHGDWISVHADQSCVIYGRSDATINRHGLRMGTSELYAAVEALSAVQDSMAVDLEYLGRDSRLLMFIVMRDGHRLDDSMRTSIRDAIKNRLSPRFIPDDLIEAPAIPRTLSGKKQEIPIRKLFLGQPIERVLNREAMANPECLEWYVGQAARMGRPTA